MVGAVDRHADVVQQRAAGHHDLGVPGGHAVVGDHRRFDPGLGQQPQQPQGDVEHDLHVDPGVVRHAEPLGVDLGHVPPGADLLVLVDRVEELLQLAVAAGRRPDPGLGDRLLGGLRRRPLRVGGGDRPRAHRRSSVGGGQSAIVRGSDQPQTGQGLEPTRVEQRLSVVLLGLGGRGRVAGATDRFPGAVVELVLAPVGAIGGDSRRIAAGLASARSRRALPARRRRAAWRRARGVRGAALLGARFDPATLTRIARWKRPTGACRTPILAGCGRRRRSVATTSAAGRESRCGEGNAGDQDRDEICAFREQARNRGGICGPGGDRVTLLTHLVRVCTAPGTNRPCRRTLNAPLQSRRVRSA